MRHNITLFQFLSRSVHMRHGLWYLGSNIVAAFIPLLLLPILTRTLEPAAYGTYSLFTMVIAAAVPLVTWTFSSIIAREYGLRDAAGFRRFFTVCLSITLLLALFWSVLAGVAHSFLRQFLSLPVIWVQCGIACALAQGLSATMQSLSAMRKQPVQYSYWRLGYALSMGAAIYTGAMLGNGWEAIGQLQTIAAFTILCIVLLVTARHGWLERMSWNEATQDDASLAIRYSTPLVIHILTAGFLLQSMDRLFISHYLGLAEAGSYNAAQQISLTMALLITSMNQVWQPWLNERLQENTSAARAQVVRTTYYGFAGLWAAGALAIAVIWVIFPYLIGPEFQSARMVVPILMAAGILTGMYVLVAAPLFFYGNTLHIMLCNIGTALVTLLLNALLVPEFGMMGAAYATFGATGFMFASIWITGMRLYKLPWLSAWKQPHGAG